MRPYASKAVYSIRQDAASDNLNHDAAGLSQKTVKADNMPLILPSDKIRVWAGAPKRHVHRAASSDTAHCQRGDKRVNNNQHEQRNGEAAIQRMGLQLGHTVSPDSGYHSSRFSETTYLRRASRRGSGHSHALAQQAAYAYTLRRVCVPKMCLMEQVARTRHT